MAQLFSKLIIWQKLIVYLVFALWSVVKELKHDVTCSDAVVSVQGDAVLWQPVIGIIAAPPQLEGGAAHLLNTWDMSLPIQTPGQWLFHIANSSIFQLPQTPPTAYPVSIKHLFWQTSFWVKLLTILILDWWQTLDNLYWKSWWLGAGRVPASEQSLCIWYFDIY